VAIPVAIVAWFLGGKRAIARANRSGTAIAGDVTTGNGGLAIGHYDQITFGSAHVIPTPEKKSLLAGEGQGVRFQVGIGDY
jgi:uncharacterized membrane protein YqiK